MERLQSESAAVTWGDRWIRWATTASVMVLAGIAAAVSYRHMHTLTLAHGESPWTAALTPVSVDGMIVASSMTLLADSRAGRSGGLPPWLLLVVGSGASLAANVAVAEPTAYGRVIAAWPSFALIGAYELLIRQIRNQAARTRLVTEVAEAASGAVASPAAVVRDEQRVALAPVAVDRKGPSAAEGPAVPLLVVHGMPGPAGVGVPVERAEGPPSGSVRQTGANAPAGDAPSAGQTVVTRAPGGRTIRISPATLAAAKRIDGEHRGHNGHPASAATLRRLLRIGAPESNHLVKILRGRIPAGSLVDAATTG
jgi:Protein of unknown function (DUF2637)